MIVQKFVRKPLYVDAVRVTVDNFLDVALWANGTPKDNSPERQTPRNTVDPENQHIWIKVHKPLNERQTKAYVGDWILATDRGYKVYTDKAFKMSFDSLEGVEADKAVQAAKTQPEDLTPLQQAATEAGYPTDPNEGQQEIADTTDDLTDPDEHWVGAALEEAPPASLDPTA